MKLEEIQNPQFLKTLSKKQLESLAEDIRQFLIEHVSKTGGHLSSNLGVVELTIAMHYVFNSPHDKLLFDVGHQCYTHKILTGRAKDFSTLRQFGGLSGFINKDESIHDIWESGHSSTTLSAQCGFLLSSSLESDAKVVVMIGDASISNGISFEALNYMGGVKNLNPIIILNDNKMSISRSVGAASRSLSKLRSTNAYQKMNTFFARHTPNFMHSFFHSFKTSIKGFILKENIFEDWGYDYMGPYDGNDMMVCIRALNSAKKLNKPCVIHFITQKGKGYSPAEKDEEGDYHGVGKFNIETGNFLDKIPVGMGSYSKIMSICIERLLAKETYYVITPAMLKGSELVDLKKKYPQNIIDVGMAEEHAAVLSSAISQNHKKVILLLYSTFAQRAYDYLLNDIARNDIHVIIGIDRADFVPGDGSTHQGVYDLAMWNSMPNVEVCSPMNGDELYSLMLYGANTTHPFVIRYGKTISYLPKQDVEQIIKPSWSLLNEGKDIIIITYGENIVYIQETLKEVEFSYTLVNARFIQPIDEEMLQSLLDQKKPILVYETCIDQGGLADKILKYCFTHQIYPKMKCMNLPVHSKVSHGDMESLRKQFHLSKEDIINESNELLKAKK